nr:NAD(P)/FAD-dependent oxidoreductase [Skermania sp. ID1734]
MESAAAESEVRRTQRVHRTRVLIVGTGFSGLGMAIALKKAGQHNFLIVEKADDIGGTWRENTYPGCACDVPSHMYSYSFEQNANWSKMWSEQPEILDYLRRVVDKYDLRSHIHFGVEADGGEWDERTAKWHVATTGGAEYVAQFVVSGIGALHIPNIPRFAGVERFRGASWHSAQWNHDFDLTGKRVAVIGTGASAIQLIPEIVDRVAHLDVYQRTPAWVLPRTNFPIPHQLRALFRRVPLTRMAFRDGIYWVYEALGLGLNGHANLMRPLERIAEHNIARGIDDPELRRKLTPRYRIGCKRILGSNDYYPALNRPNVSVITDPIAQFTENGIVTADGTDRPADAVIYATGFHVTDGFQSMNIAGIGGRKLVQEWNEHGIQSYYGICARGFPNAFFLLGPNTGLGHNSVVFMIEQQIKYVMKAMELVDSTGAAGLDVRTSAQDRFNSEIQHKLAGGVWSTGGCTSWYLDSKGVNRTIWPGFTWQYWRRTRKLNPDDFELLARTP